jgi:hypothetical protein
VGDPISASCDAAENYPVPGANYHCYSETAGR